ncbi:PBSX family phage terminase large subunit [Weissella muntiaci]|uniref:PBSX family phage terminase large subunit n=1 Tax=Weissella muntiaci TaxID=2508881 RepID=A0A6C2C738_9LACO|nr:PBSX family phage terminase large subunit [Weissella muntiaci]TYC49617.1 PBSX family phage terminase large subunit [Weissella muntiaci]
MAEINWNLPEMVSGAYAPLFTDKRKYIVYKGSRGSGKSEAVARKVIFDIVTLPYVNWLVVRRFANTNRQSTFTLLQKVATKMGVGNLFKFNSSLPEITYKPTGQKILFRGADKPLSITSISVEVGNLSRLWVEEAYQLELEESFQTIDESMRGIIDDPNGFYQIVITFNPWSERHWLKGRFFDDPASNTLSLTTTYKDNPFLDDEYVDSLMEMVERNPRRARVAVFGDWGIAEGLVFDNFVIEDFELDKILKEATYVVRGLDFGYSHDPTAFSEAAVNMKTKDIYVFTEMYQVGMKTQQIFNWLVEHRYQNSVISAEWASGGDRLIDELREKGINKIKRARKYEVLYGISFMQDFKIHIRSNLTHAIDEFNSYAFGKDTNGDWLPKPIDKDNHFIDSLRYALEPIMVSQRSSKDKMEAFKKLGLGR